MRPDADQPDPADATIDEAAPARDLLPALARGARLIATPAAIVVAWIVVVTQWNSSDEQLFNWATTTAAVVLGIVSGAWLLSLRFPALRRALLPFEGGLVVGALVLAAATQGHEVDMLGDRVAISIAFGVLAALLLAFVHPLVAGRHRARLWLGGVVVACTAAGIAVPAALDWLEGGYPGDVEFASGAEVIARGTARGFRLDDVSLGFSVAPLASGYFDDVDVASGGIYAAPAMPIEMAAPIDPATDEPLVVQDGMAVPVAGSALESTATVPGDWAQLLAQPDGTIQLAVTQAVANDVDDRVIGSLRRGTCGTASNAKALATVDIAQGAGRVERDLPIRVDDLQIDDQLSIVIGTARPLAPTRCLELLSSSGIALAQMGAASFVSACVEPLDLPRGGAYQVTASSFQDPGCATRFDEYARMSGALLVPRSRLAEYRDCHRDREADVATSEQQLANGAIAVTYPDSGFGACVPFGANASAYGAFAAAPGAVAHPGVAYGHP